MLKKKFTAKDRKKLFKKAWKFFSIHIRKSAADYRGYTRCVTCGASYLWNSGSIHAGHWIHDKLDFDERNIHPQCRSCNYAYNKNTNTAYAVYMARTYGAEEMERIRKYAMEKGNDYSVKELENTIQRYTLDK